jgi:hypothetical protein
MIWLWGIDTFFGAKPGTAFLNIFVGGTHNQQTFQRGYWALLQDV